MWVAFTGCAVRQEQHFACFPWLPMGIVDVAILVSGPHCALGSAQDVALLLSSCAGCSLLQAVRQLYKPCLAP